MEMHMQYSYCVMFYCEWLAESHEIKHQERLRGIHTIIEFDPAVWRIRGEFTEAEILLGPCMMPCDG